MLKEKGKDLIFKLIFNNSSRKMSKKRWFKKLSNY